VVRRYKRKEGKEIYRWKDRKENEQFHEGSREGGDGDNLEINQCKTVRTAVSTMKLRSASFSAKVRNRTVDQELDMYVMHRLLISSL
jgi:hypothetical protein